MCASHGSVFLHFWDLAVNYELLRVIVVGFHHVVCLTDFKCVVMCRMYMKLLWELCGTWLSILVMHCAWWRRRESLHSYICARPRDQKWHGLWQP
jgi:hypothetical protein